MLAVSRWPDLNLEMVLVVTMLVFLMIGYIATRKK